MHVDSTNGGGIFQGVQGVYKPHSYQKAGKKTQTSCTLPLVCLLKLREGSSEMQHLKLKNIVYQDVIESCQDLVYMLTIDTA